MNIIQRANTIGKTMTVGDFSLLKLSVFFMTLFLITVWQDFRELALGIAWYWHLIIALILMVPLMKKFFAKLE